MVMLDTLVSTLTRLLTCRWIDFRVRKQLEFGVSSSERPNWLWGPNSLVFSGSRELYIVE